MKRKMVLLNSMILVVSLLAVSFVAQSRIDAKASTANLGSGLDVLRFPVNNFTEQALTYGASNVTYRLYRHIAYVANPVDLNYESLDVAVPVEINGQDINAANAPILLAVNAGGYLSSSNLATGAGQLLGSTNCREALAAGFVVVVPGLLGRDRVLNGTWLGKAPAGIVHLKAAVRYIRYNKGVIPGNSDWIIAAGISGGGALSSILGASGDSPLYDAALDQIGAANASDAIFASAPYCPITDLDHADMAYEWEFGTTLLSGSLVNQSISQQLKNLFSTYQASLKLQGKNAYGNLTADNYGDYLVKTYLIPSANKYLTGLANENRATYLANRTWITWSNNSALFTWADYVAYIGRSKKLPAFDAFDLSGWENSLFGNSTTNARHFTNFSLQQASGNPNALLDADLPTTVNIMNPMYFIMQNYSGCAQYWFIRSGTKDTDTAHTIFGNLAASLENRGKNVNASLYWDGGHGVNQDPEVFVAWVRQITNYSIVLSAADSWSLVAGSRPLKAYPNLAESIWQKNATMAPNGPYDKIGLHRLVKTGVTTKAAVFLLPASYGSGEQMISNPPQSNYSIDESSNTAMYWANRGFDVYSIDYRAHFLPLTFNATQASAIASNWGWDVYISDIKEAVDQAKALSGYSKIFLAGISLGGNAAMYYASKYWLQDLKGIILLDASEQTAQSTSITNKSNVTSSLNSLNASNRLALEYPNTPGGTYPSGMLFAYQYALQNPGAPAQYPPGTPLTPTVNPLTNKTWTNITELFAYGWYSTNFSNVYAGYGNVTANIQRSATADRILPMRLFVENTALHDWNNCPFISYDFDDHYKEINVPVLGFRSALWGIPNYGNFTNGLATTDLTQITLPNYGHLDVVTGTYSAKDVSEPAYQWMLSHSGVLPAAAPLTASAFSSATVWTGWTWWFSVHDSGGVAPYTFQWYEGTTLLAGQTSTALPVTKNTPGTYTYYCKVTDSAGATANSNTVTLTVVT